MKKILIIAGSDSGGGAGVQADIKTAAAHGVFATTAITAITAQNTHGVHAVQASEPEMVQAQIEEVLGDIGADAIKIGMLANSEIAQTVANCLANTSAPIILDPVMVATSGDSLLDEEAVNVIKTHLIPLATMVTPNIPEAEILADMRIKSLEDMHRAAEKILDMGCNSALIKGGHMKGDHLVNLLASEKGSSEFEYTKIETHSTHGTGCTLASAVACGLALGQSMKESVENAGNYVHQAILNAPDIGTGSNKPIKH